MEAFLKAVSALNDESRVKILSFLLRHRCCCVCEIEASLDMAQSTLSRHLKILKDAGFLCISKRGSRSYYDICASSQMHANMLKEVDALKLKTPIKICAENSTRCKILGK